MSLEALIKSVKQHPRISQAGMILCHNGFVRESNRSHDRQVQALRVAVDHSVVEQIQQWAESQPGIVAVAIEALEGEFSVGDDLLFVVVAGDLREHVFSAMRETIEKIKTQAVKKTEYYID